MDVFGFQKLDVYRCAVELLKLSLPLATRMPRGYGALGDQLRRAVLSVSLNIAEGSGKFTKDAQRFYAIARGSALECAAIFDALETIEPTIASDLQQPRSLLDRIVGMLTKMIRR